MALPWLQIVQLVPSILDVSRELLRKTKQPEHDPQRPSSGDASADALIARITALEENERRQAELVSQMAEQIAAMTRAMTALHRRVLWLSVGCGAALVSAVIALVVALQ
jgi:hypothetical protein